MRVPEFPHRLIFVRHGETAYNAENRLQGQMDTPLNARGREQAGAVVSKRSAAGKRGQRDTKENCRDGAKHPGLRIPLRHDEPPPCGLRG